MAAGEDELQSLVPEGGLLHVVLRRLGDLEQAALGRQRAIAADAVGRPVARGRHQPRAWIVGRAVARPALGGDRERLLSGLLGEVAVAEEADQGSEDVAPLVAKGLFEGCPHPTMGRTSIAPPRRAAGIFAASSMAASRWSASRNR